MTTTLQDRFVSNIAGELSLAVRQVHAAVELLDEGATVPFIARYRKEMTGSLDEVMVTAIRDRIRQLRELDKRREAILASLEERELLTDERIHRNKVHVKVIGRVNLLPQSLQHLIADVENATANYDNQFLNFAFAYGGRAEIVDATKSIAEKVKNGELNLDDIDESTVEKYLYTSHMPKQEPDLIVRTSGEERLSGFLLWQSAYSELCFLDVYWPDFRLIDLLRAIRTFQKRKRRYGA